MKRILAMLLIGVLLSSPLCCFADAAYDHADFAAEWQRFAVAENEIHMTMNWALSYAEDYLADRSWDNLLKARHAVSSAKAYLAYMELPAAELSQEAYLDFLSCGHDLSVMLVEWEELAVCCSDSLVTLGNLGDSLDREVFWSYDVEVLQMWLDCEKRYQAGLMEYYALLTDYVLTTADSPEQRRAEEAAFAAACPEMFRGYQWIDDDPSIQKKAAIVLDRLDAILDEKDVCSGMRTANILLMVEAIKSGDESILRDNAETIGDLPGLIPDPGWLTMDGEGFEYTMTEEETGDSLYTMPGTPIDDDEISCSAILEGVSRDEFDSYVANLQASGVVFYSDDVTDEQRTLIFANGYCSFAFSWRGGYVIYMADGQVMLAPRWYIQTLG